MALIKSRAYFLDADYVFRKGETYLRLLMKGKRTFRLYMRYDPYFYVDAPHSAKETLAKLTARTKIGETVKVLRVEECERTVLCERKKIFKVFASHPQHVPALKGAVPYPCFEYNIPFAKRAIIDLKLVPFSLVEYKRERRIIKEIIKITQAEKPPALTRMAFDIETYNPLGAPQMDKDPIIMISYETEVDGKTERGVISTKDFNKEYAILCKDEKEMLEKFSEIVQRVDPDVLYGYNSANFDLTYMLEREKAVRAKLNIGRGKGKITPIKRGMVAGMRVEGRIHFDIYPTVRFFGFIGLVKTGRFTLEAVYAEMSGKKKKMVKRAEIWEMWDRNELEELADYSMNDAKATLEIGDKVLPLQTEMATIAKMPLFDVTLSTSGQLVESLLMFNANTREEIVPNRPNDAVIKERDLSPIQGAFVKLPEPGIYENIAVMDFRGLYPSIIVSYNIDPFTVIKTGNKKAGTPDSRLETESGAHEAPTGVRFSKKKIGMIPETLEWLVEFRSKIKKEIKKHKPDTLEYIHLSARSHALKILANSFYGYMLYSRSRWYSRECGESVTALGRMHIQNTIQMAEKVGFSVLYGDTDSIFSCSGTSQRIPQLNLWKK